jgi:hypothetical protein
MMRRTKYIDPAVKRFRRLMEHDFSLESYWYTINQRDGRAAQSTVEALMFSLRRGPDALSNPNTLDRLVQLSDRQLTEVATRVQKFTDHIARAWTAEQVATLIAVREKLK